MKQKYDANFEINLLQLFKDFPKLDMYEDNFKGAIEYAKSRIENRQKNK